MNKNKKIVELKAISKEFNGERVLSEISLDIHDNEFITLLKETSVAFYIGVADLTMGGLKIRSITYSNFMPLIAVALIYLIIVIILTKLVGILERRLRKSDR